MTKKDSQGMYSNDNHCGTNKFIHPVLKWTRIINFVSYNEYSYLNIH